MELPPTITPLPFDFHSAITEVIGQAVDLRGDYPAGLPGIECLTCRKVVIDGTGKHHILSKDDQDRFLFIVAHFEYIQQALSYPEYIYAEPQYKHELRRWSQVYAVEVPATGRFMTVVVSLARIDEPEAPHHIL